MNKRGGSFAAMSAVDRARDLLSRFKRQVDVAVAMIVIITSDRYGFAQFVGRECHQTGAEWFDRPSSARPGGDPIVQAGLLSLRSSRQINDFDDRAVRLEPRFQIARLNPDRALRHHVGVEGYIDDAAF